MDDDTENLWAHSDAIQQVRIHYMLEEHFALVRAARLKPWWRMKVAAVDGTLTLGSSFGVVVGGVARPEVGDYRICSADTVEGTVNPALLTVTPFPGDPRPYKVLVDAEGVVLRVLQSGCCVIFR